MHQLLPITVSNMFIFACVIINKYESKLFHILIFKYQSMFFDSRYDYIEYFSYSLH